MSQPVKIRFRNDGWHWAEYKCDGIEPEKLLEWGYSADDVERYRTYPPAQPGDIWRVRWAWSDPATRIVDVTKDGPIAGYAICCPKCLRVHAWTTATNCSSRGKAGPHSCNHSGNGSCWDWSGSAEEGTLTARPSLFNQAPDCGWHGWLTDGVLRAC